MPPTPPKSPEEWGQEFELLRPAFTLVEQHVEAKLRDALYESTRDIVVMSISTRVKTKRSFVEKICRKQYADPLAEISDLAGVRIVCLYESDLEHVKEIVDGLFEIEPEEPQLKADYLGHNLTVRMKAEHFPDVPEDIRRLTCEIQLHSAMGAISARVSHDHIYADADPHSETLQPMLTEANRLIRQAQILLDEIRDATNKRKSDLAVMGEGILDEAVFMESLRAYAKHKWPRLPRYDAWLSRIVTALPPNKYKTIRDLDAAFSVGLTRMASIGGDLPDFRFSSGIMAMALALADPDFRKNYACNDSQDVFLNMIPAR